MSLTHAYRKATLPALCALGGPATVSEVLAAMERAGVGRRSSVHVLRDTVLWELRSLVNRGAAVVVHEGGPGDPWMFAPSPLLTPPLLPRPPMLRPLDEHNRERFAPRPDPNAPAPNGLACPTCGEELVDARPMETLTSDPPQKVVRCPACGYHGYRFV